MPHRPEVVTPRQSTIEQARANMLCLSATYSSLPPCLPAAGRDSLTRRIGDCPKKKCRQT